MYVYRLGDDEAALMFQPGPGQIEFCMASVICDEEGNLYYTNDSGHLFKIAGNGPVQGGGSGGGETGDNGGSGGETGGGGNGGSGGGNDGQTGAGSGNGGQTGGGNGAGGQTGGNGGQAGGSSGDNGQSGSNSNAGASGTPTVGNTNSTTPPSKIPVTGSVPTGAKPLAKGTSDKKEDTSQRDAAADSGEKTQDVDSAVAPESASSAQANVARDMPVPARIAFVAGAVGVTGLVASGLWMAFTRRHKEV